MIGRKLIRKISNNVPEAKRKFFMYQYYREYQLLVKNKKLKLDDKDKEEIKEYWSKYRKNISLDTHNVYYNLTKVKDKKFIPDYLYYGYIDYYFNNMKYNTAFEDKNYYDIWFKDFNRPKSIVHNVAGVYYDTKYNIINKIEAVNLVNKAFKTNKELIIKATVETCSGHNIKFFNEKDDISDLFDSYKNGNFIVQELVKQHKDLAKMHKESVNTIRTASLLWKDEVHILSSIIRIGVNDSRFDNSHQGGLAVGIKSDGSLRECGFDQYSTRYDVHPNGFKFKNGKIPNYDKLLDTIKKAHAKFGHFKLIHWDFSVDENGDAILIEFNLGQGGIYMHQFSNGPFFGDLTDEILEEVFKK
ncbi:MAG: hypothetical protein IJZ36_04085 [Bacilli bacterium]|nr:hypothetical protein [Bacilli bacterium]